MTAHVLPVATSLVTRGLLALRRIPAIVIPTVIFPIVIVVAFSGAYGGLTRLSGFPVDDMIDWMLPMAIVQGATFSGVNAAFALVIDLENGFFDRLRVSPAPRIALVVAPLMGAIVRALIPLVAVLTAGVIAGAHLRGGVLGIVTLVVAAVGSSIASSAWATGLALRIRSMKAAPLVQSAIFAVVFVSTAQVPLAVMTGWLKVVARYNPMTYILELSRQGFIGQVSWEHSWRGLVAIVVAGLGLTLFAVRGLASFDRD